MNNYIIFILIGIVLVLSIVCFVLNKKYKDQKNHIEVHSHIRYAKTTDEDNSMALKKEREWEDKFQKLRQTVSVCDNDKKIAQETIKNLRSKISEQYDDIQSLSKQITDSEKNVKELERNTDSLKLQLNSEHIKINCVKELLSAPVINNPNIREIQNNINHLVNLVSSDLRNYLDIYQDQITIQDEIDKDSIIRYDVFQWGLSAKKHWTHMKTCVAFTGLYNSGKTTIINSIIKSNCPTAVNLPVDNRPTTTIPTFIANGKNDRFAFYTPFGELKEVNKKVFTEMSNEFVSSIGNVSSILKYFVVEYNSPSLKTISILDTPGFESGNNNKEDERTFSVVRNCDAIFWVFDVNMRPGADTINAIKKITESSVVKTRPLYAVINKTDTSTTERTKEYRELLTRFFSEINIPISGIFEFNRDMDVANLLGEINSVERIAKPELFLDNLKRLLDTIKDDIASKIRVANAHVTDTMSQFNAHERKLNDAISSLGESGAIIAGLPEFVERWRMFGGDYYKLSYSKGQELKSKANAIKDKFIPEINSLHTQIKEYERAHQSATSQLSELNLMNSRYMRIYNECISLIETFQNHNHR